MSGLKSIVASLWHAIQSMAEGEEKIVGDEQIIDTARYLEEMGYDLYGYGFVTDQDVIETDEETKEKKLKVNGGKLTGSKSAYRYLTAYLVSDNYAYTIKNSNKNFVTAFSSKESFLSGLGDATGWGTGLISIYHQADYDIADGEKYKITGIPGKAYGLSGDDYAAGALAGILIAQPTTTGKIIGGAIALVKTIENWDTLTSSIKVNRDQKTLEIAGPGLFNGTKFAYKLDGWTGRYSMPLEFLLSVHVATMAPDLSYKIATSFPTDLEILLYTPKAKGSKVAGGLKVGEINAEDHADIDGGANIYTYKEFNEKNRNLFEDGKWDLELLDTLCFSRKDAAKVFKDGSFSKLESQMGESRYACQGAYTTEQVYPETNYDTNYKVTYDADMGYYSWGWDGGTFPHSDPYTPRQGVTTRFTVEWPNDDKSSDEFYLKITEGNNNDWYNLLYTEYLKSRTSFENYEISNFNELRPNGEAFAITDQESFEKALKLNLKKDGDTVDRSCLLLKTECPLQNGVHVNPANEYYYWNSFEFDASVPEAPEIEYTFEFVIRADKYCGSGTWRDDGKYRIGLVCWKNNYAEMADSADETCSARRVDKTCRNCRDYLRTIYGALAAMQETDFKTYVPYINRVTNHWFRNVYFTQGAIDMSNKEETKPITVKDEDGTPHTVEIVVGGTDRIIQVDEEYEKQTGERWTLFDTYKGKYELYVYLKGDDGEYEESFAENGELVCRETEGGRYKLAENGVTYVKAESGEGEYDLYKMSTQIIPGSGEQELRTYSLYTETANVDEFRVGKKAITKSGNIWEDGMAYDPNPVETTKEWRKYEVSTDTDYYMQQVVNEMGFELVYLHEGYTVKQDEDGVRGETNPKIKKLFLDEYYLYDGSTERAALIEKAKEKAGDDDPDTFLKTFGKDEKISVTVKDENDNDVTYTATIDQISGPISLQHSSLTAFAMLRNMKTLDAEFIYHDFKELIVELDYFDKEDLLEPDGEVMMFPVIGVSSEGWPDPEYDKNEDVYGTMIYSAEDYAKKRAETDEKLKQIVAENDAIQEPLDESSVPSNPTNATVTESGDVTYNNIFLQAAEDIHYYMEQNNYTYCVYGGNSNEECGEGDTHGLSPTFEESKTGYKHCCCATLVMWSCKAIGMEWVESHGADALFAQLEALDCTEKIPYSRDALQPGDIVHCSSHVQIFAGFDESGNMTWYNAGSGESIRKASPYVGTDTWTTFDYIIRITDWEGLSYNGVAGGNGYGTVADFEGFTGGETVVAPVTGEVIKYGTTSRKNIETGKSDTVGYIKIKVLGEQAVPGKECTFFDDEGYNYFWEEYTFGGIASHVLYIEGFKIPEGLDVGDVKGQNIKNLKTYIESNPSNYSTKYTVPNILDDVREEELRQQEEAKKDAPAVVEKEGKIYIKEGSPIGITYSTADGITEEQTVQVTQKSEDSDEVTTTEQKFQVGNYLRMILRDTQGEIVENIEEYVEVDSSSCTISDDYDTRADQGNCTVTKEEFKTIFANREKIVEHTDDFFEMQEKYNVSAVFAAAVCIQEQGGGTADTIHVQNNNWFSQTAGGDGTYTTQNGRTWASFTTVKNSILNFGKNIAEGSYYYTQGKYKISEIGPVYCEGNEWAGHISGHITTALEKLKGE